jgi:hypothetical protein
MVVQALLWPIVLLIAPSSLRDLRHIYNQPTPEATFPKIELEGWIPPAPPRCTSILSYSQQFSGNGDAFGSFTFDVGELLSLLRERLTEDCSGQVKLATV